MLLDVSCIDISLDPTYQPRRLAPLALLYRTVCWHEMAGLGLGLEYGLKWFDSLRSVSEVFEDKVDRSQSFSNQ
jgi:hypothetical protein